MRSILATIVISCTLFSCHSIGEKAKSAINKTGEVVGEGGSEFVKGVSKGVDNSLESQIKISDALAKNGVSFGRCSVSEDTGSEHKNKLVVYLIFDQDFSGDLSARVNDSKGIEYGRARIKTSVKKGEAKYFDFIFDQRTDIESKSTIVIE